MTISSKFTRYIKYLVTLFLVSILIYTSAVISNAAEATNITNSTLAPAYTNLKDNNSATYSYIDSLTLKNDSGIAYIYMIFWDTPTSGTVTAGDITHSFSGDFLHQLITLPSDIQNAKDITINFEKKVYLSDISVFTEGALPSWVQDWELPYDRADLLLNTTHADDEQLFFAGVLPYYTAKGYRVQVSYFTDHFNTPNRRHELLNGLWTVGVDHYPVISSFPDAYSESIQGALNNLAYSGFTEDNVIAYQVEILRRFKPQVVIGHDINGEYGHGQHMLNTSSLIKAVESASNSELYTDSASKYGIWDTKKLYLHLYNENTIILNWDEPLEEYSGKTAFQMTQEGFKCHVSQHYTWFNGWLNGTYGNITSASQIRTYSPCKYGLYRTTVGDDVQKNDFFENIISYSEQERLEQERLEQERLEQLKREEEENRRLEEESKRLESEAEASRAEASRLESIKLEKEKKEHKSTITKAIISVIILIASLVTLIVLIITKNKKR